MRAKTLFALLFLLELGWSAYYCADTGLYYSDRAFCDAVCGSPCQTLIANPQGLPCDDTNYELFIYNPQTKKTIAITKERGRWEDFTNLLVIEDANDNEAGRQVLSYLGVRAWIGMYDPELSPSYNSINPDRFVWWDGTAVSYTNWAEGEPDNRVEGAGGEPPLGEHWAFMKTDGTWGDGDKDTRLRALVMWRKRLDCVNGLPESDRTRVDDMIKLFCGGETPCFLCTDGEEIDRCSLGEAFSGERAWLCGLGKTLCDTEKTCGRGGFLSGNVCVADATVVCKAGGTYSSGVCRADATLSCGAGGTLSSDTCYAPATPVCPPGGSFDKNTESCVAKRRWCGWIKLVLCCPSGYRWDGRLGKCVSPPIGWNCPPGYAYNPGTGRCEAEPRRDCPPGYSLDTATGECVAPPDYLCPSGYINNPNEERCEAPPKISMTCPVDPSLPCIRDADGKYYCSANPCLDASSIPPTNTDTQEGANDIPADGEITAEGCSGTVYIMSGRDMRCRPPGTQTGFSNCCRKTKTWFGLGRCSSTEQVLAKMRSWGRLDGNCHYVGEYCAEEWLGVCVQKKKTYCCFSSPLARIIHQQGRPQLGIGWGTPESPNCRGFTAQEFQKLDFSKMNFSEWIEEEVKKNVSPKIERNIRNVIRGLQ